MNPILSCGIICFKIDNISLYQIDNFLFNKYIIIEEYNYNNIDYINKINFHRTDIKFLMIQRKHSFSYIDFIRGKYSETDINKINSLFELMSKSEVDYIKNNNFNTLWNNLWKKTANTKQFILEQKLSKSKFNYLKKHKLFNLLISKYNSPEWEFPKGRHNKYENNIKCANREFKEETNLNNYIYYTCIEPINETFIGTNNINYKYIYYFGSSKENVLSYSTDNYEIGNIGWFTIDEILQLLRPYNIEKQNIIKQIYFFLCIINDKMNL